MDYRGWLRVDLGDPVGVGQRFSDGDLNRAVARAVGEVSLVWPRVLEGEVVMAGASRVVPLVGGSFPGLIDVEEVEWPYGVGGSEATYPASLRAFRVAPDRGSVTMVMEEVPSAGSRVRVRWCSAHSVLEGSTTVPAELDGVVVTGASGYAMLAYSTPSADNFKYEDGGTVSGVDDSMIPKEWRARASEALERFQAALAGLKRRRAVSGVRVVSWASGHEAAVWPAS